MADDSPLSRLKQRAQALGEKALQDLLGPQQRADALGLAARGVSHGRRLLDERAQRLVAGLGLATQADLERVSRKVGRLRKKLEAVLDEV